VWLDCNITAKLIYQIIQFRIVIAGVGFVRKRSKTKRVRMLCLLCEYLKNCNRSDREMAAVLDIDHRDMSRRIYRMNKRMEQEIGETIIEKYGHKWKLIPRLRRDFAATGR
jgi:hypothetical protein